MYKLLPFFQKFCPVLSQQEISFIGFAAVSSLIILLLLGGLLYRRHKERLPEGSVGHFDYDVFISYATNPDPDRAGELV